MQGQPAFKSLVKSRILTVRMGEAGNFELLASHYIGTIVLENSWRITVTEKVIGTTAGLFNFLSQARLKVPQGYSDASTDGVVFVHIVKSFVEAVEKYVGIGRKKEYQLNSFDTERPSGRILMKETIRHFSRGIQNVVTVSAFRLSANVFPNQVIAYCLAEIEVLAARYIALTELLNRTRNLFLLFSDVSYADIKNEKQSNRAASLKLCLRQPALSKELRTALEMAFPLLCGGGVFGEVSSTFKNQALFFDLEFLFEYCVLIMFQGWPGLDVRRGADYARKLLGPHTTRYKCEPDIVIRDTKDQILSIGDVKYKDLDRGLPDNSDVYQLLAHASAFAVAKCFLIYPSDVYSRRTIGRTSHAIELIVFTVRPSHLSVDVGLVLEALRN
jgi:5-methylcytosine-specific restriction endonuclease McrBC regulatory subunit McrC